MLTPEQAFAIQQIGTGMPVRLIAFAGAGKTSTLVAAAKAHGYRRGMYICFNKSIAAEASEKFPRNVWCKTSHALAFKEVANRGFSVDKMTKSPYHRQVHEAIFGDGLPVFPDGIGLKAYATAVQKTVQNFMISWDARITEWHVPTVAGLTEEAQAWLQKSAETDAAKLWARMADPNDSFPLGHDGYVKVWALSNPRLRQDFIMLDEAQDTAQVLVGVLREQSAQVISVGDSWQAIYEWRGAKDALRILPGTECRLTQSFRFGPSIAHAANRVLFAMGETHPLRGRADLNDTVLQPDGSDVDAVLCRTNAGMIGVIMSTRAGRSCYIPGGTTELIRTIEDLERLQNGEPATSIDLCGFLSWAALKEHVESGEAGAIASLVRMVERYGCRRMIQVLAGCLQTHVPGCLTVCTAHKGKGLEWNAVTINDDFNTNDEDADLSLEERRLFYVAITRAKTRLYVDRHTLEGYSRAL
jgi:hypothetical protein